MTTALAEGPTAKKKLVEKFAERFSVDPTTLLHTLKSTCFRQRANEPEVTNEQMAALLIVADQYGLNPFTKEIFAFPDKGSIVPVVGVDGWARIINGHSQFDGVEFEQSENECTAIIYRKDRAKPIKVTEYHAECKRDTGPWRSHPRRMLRHKALIQCSRLAFGFAGIFDEDEAERIVDVTPSSAGASAAAAAASIKIPMPTAKSAEPAAPAAEQTVGESSAGPVTIEHGTGEVIDGKAPDQQKPAGKPASKGWITAAQSRAKTAGYSVDEIAEMFGVDSWDGITEAKCLEIVDWVTKNKKS